MYGVLPTMPITDLRTNQPEILKQLRRSPIVLTRQGHDAGVLVHPRVWNFLIEVYEKANKRGLLDIDESELAVLEELDPALFINKPEPVKELA